MSEKILVTGGAGFIGSAIVDLFVAEGFDVVVIDNLHTGKRENLNPAARFYHADLRNAAQIKKIFEQERPTLISHQAALANVRDSYDDPVGYIQTNIVGTINLLEAACAVGSRKLIFASTGGAIYGDLPNPPATEASPMHPLDPYGVSKLAAEHYLFSYRHNRGLDYCILRYPNVYGPRQDPFGEGGVVAIFTQRMLVGEQAYIYGDGRQQRDFTYVGDIARANLLASQRGNGIYNIGTGVGTDINTIFRELATLTEYQQPEVHAPAKPGEVRISILDATRAKEELGWQPQISLTEGLAHTIAFFRH